MQPERWQESKLRLDLEWGSFSGSGICGVRLSQDDPLLCLVAPAQRVYPATQVVLRYLSLNEGWRE